MAEYLLIYGQPRRSASAPPVIYEAKRLQAEHDDDDAAICWARDEVPRLQGVPQAEEGYQAAPMVLWRIEPTRREVVWARDGVARARLVPLAGPKP
jgi:hypothetical protein